MSLNGFIIRQFIVSSVLLSALQCSNAVRYSRSMLYSAPPMRKHIHQWKYAPYIHIPRSMQRRFMWKEMDETVDGLMSNAANGARPINQVFPPPMIRYRKPFEFDIQASKKMKYVVKKPPGPPPPPFKRMKVIKFRAPIKQQIPLYNHVPIPESPPVILTTPKSSVVMSFMSEDELRKIEKEQEKRVENEEVNSGGGGVGIHEHSHQTHMDDDIVSGRINEFGEGWLPMKAGTFSTPKSFALSKLHTKVEGIETISSPTALPLVLSEPLKNQFSYEVTEYSAEASVQKEQTFKPSTYNFDFLATTTESPNYPEHFLKGFSKNDDDFKPMRVSVITTTLATTTPPPTTTPSSRRLPARTTTEHPFKRYNLHRPKPSKLLFNRPTSTLESAKQTQTATTTENSFKVTLELLEPLKTTRESIRTTREPSTSTPPPTTTKKPKKTPPEKVRTTRMNSDGKSKLRIKNVSQNENLNKVLNKHRGSVKFGEKTKTS